MSLVDIPKQSPVPDYRDAKIAALEAEGERLRKDAARLDFLDKLCERNDGRGKHTYPLVTDISISASPIANCRMYLRDWRNGGNAATFAGNNIRELIDSALGAKDSDRGGG